MYEKCMAWHIHTYDVVTKQKALHKLETLQDTIWKVQSISLCQVKTVSSKVAFIKLEALHARNHILDTNQYHTANLKVSHHMWQMQDTQEE